MHLRFPLLLPILLGLAGLCGQGPMGDPTLPPTGLRISILDVGQGDATIVIGPTGTCMLIDAGNNGDGNALVIPALRRLGISRVTYAVASHYHSDHIGGLDEVIDNFPVTSAWDRGLSNTPTTQAYKNYAKSAASKRATVGIGSVFNLGGGVTVQVLAANGQVIGGGSYPINSAAQAENAASIVLKLSYGNFSMWLGGDCTGGGNSTYDVESKIAQKCGDIDVLRVNHHGSNTSTNTKTLGLLSPEVCIVSAGYRNPYGHPTGTVTSRINNAGNSRLFLCTTSGANSLRGFGRAGTITIVTDGYRYQVTGALGQSYNIYTDEVASPPPAANSLRISEIHRSPTTTYGRYLEVYCDGPQPVNLRGLRVSSNLGSFTISTPYRLLPGDLILFQEHGDRNANGGQPLGHCWPYQAYSIGQQSDTLRLTWNASTIDSLTFNGNLAGRNSIAAERTVLNSTTSPGVFTSATRAFGTGDRGSPGSMNPVDITQFPPAASIEVLPETSTGGRAIHLIASAFDHQNSPHIMALSLGNSPGMTIGGTWIPLNPDILFDASLMLPSAIGTIPGNGRRGVRISVPSITGLQGLPAYYAHVILNPTGPQYFPAASQAVRFVFP